jgi:hypothetical protein
MELTVNENVPKPDRPERRAAHRRRVFKGAVLTFNGLGAFEAVARNLSEKGAMLAFGETTGVPMAFDLAISGEERKRPARIRWRSLNTVGVEFV